MAENPDRAMTLPPPAPQSAAEQRAALDETRRRIASTIDEIDRRVRPPAAQLARGVAGLRQARTGLELLAAGAATAGRVRGVVRTARSLSRTQLALVTGGGAAVVGLAVWITQARARSTR